MWRIGVVGLISALFAAEPALAQAGRITGTVTSTEGAAPVPGAQVHVQGTSVGAVTRDDGRYTITVQPGTYTLRVTRIGFTPDSMANVVVRADEATTADFRLSHVTGDRPRGLWLAHRVNDLYTRASLRDADTHRLFLRVLNLQTRPEVMARPDHLLRAWRASRKPPPADPR